MKRSFGWEALSCASGRRPSRFAANRLVRRYNCGGGLELSSSDAEPSADKLVQNLVASVIILTLAVLGARRLNRLMKEVLR